MGAVCVDHYEVLDEIPPDNVVEISRITKDGILEGISDECGELHFRVMDLETPGMRFPKTLAHYPSWCLCWKLG